MAPIELSVVVITLNEEANLGRCLASVKEVADDIVVVDSFSTDRTAAIAAEHGARFVQHAFEGHIEQKNWAITQAEHPWVLSLDADEELDAQLKTTIMRIKRDPQYDGYAMNRMTNYCGRWIRHGGWYPDVKLRLWDSRKGRWGGENPHDRYEMDPGARIKHVKGHILHHSFTNEEQHDRQIVYFTDISSKAAFNKGKRASLLKVMFAPVVKFLRDYLFRMGFLDGHEGLVIARKSAHAKFLKYHKLRQLAKGA